MELGPYPWHELCAVYPHGESQAEVGAELGRKFRCIIAGNANLPRPARCRLSKRDQARCRWPTGSAPMFTCRFTGCMDTRSARIFVASWTSPSAITSWRRRLPSSRLQRRIETVSGQSSPCRRRPGVPSRLRARPDPTKPALRPFGTLTRAMSWERLQLRDRFGLASAAHAVGCDYVAAGLRWPEQICASGASQTQGRKSCPAG